jgi:F-type H+-transporting ATPase subunit gamma
MPTAREVKNRIRSIKNIGQITKALEAVSASRVRRAQARVLASRAYSEKAWEILLNVQSGAATGTALHPLLTPRTEVKTAMVILVTSERGLAGAFNTNVIRAALRFGERLKVPVRYVTVGRKGRDSLIRIRANVIAEFSNPDEAGLAQYRPVINLAIDEFLNGTVDQVFVAYTDFVNTLTQRPRVLRLLPLSPYETNDQVAAEYIKEAPKVSEGSLKYEFEPSPEAILEEIVPRFTQLTFYQAILESKASEHSARMVAMRNATDNSEGLVVDLTLVYNKARQAGITSEILDIVGGAEALQGTLDKAADQLLALHQQQLLAQHSNGSAAAAAPKPKKKKTASADDLTRIEGIGPKLSQVLKAAGIDTFAKLATSSEGDIRAALTEGGIKLIPPSILSWANQAEIAARGDWQALEALQEKLVGGREA